MSTLLNIPQKSYTTLLTGTTIDSVINLSYVLKSTRTNSHTPSQLPAISLHVISDLRSKKARKSEIQGHPLLRCDVLVAYSQLGLQKHINLSPKSPLHFFSSSYLCSHPHKKNPLLQLLVVLDRNSAIHFTQPIKADCFNQSPIFFP